MIKVNRVSPPSRLTGCKTIELTHQYAVDKSKSVWNKPYIRERLLEMSHDKCIYCESKLEEDSYLRVDHFYCREHYEEKVALWHNLLPACEKCNGKKSSLNVAIEPIIDPTNQNPSDHLSLVNCVLFGKDSLGRNTQKVLQLSRRFGETWWKISKAIHDKVDVLESKAHRVSKSKLVSDQEDFSSSVLGLFEMTSPKEPFSAVAATAIVQDRRTIFIVDALKGMGCWTDDHQALYNNIKAVALV
ncbi:hypothetical protein D3869_26785 (plasmid) [Azospirillum brasilense]|uniref:HNH domain-containing protein n=1 Tax=Azospirillum brasilense TaxID=192 RepID=A0A4D8R849_AZOBR|nr:HNH endonuclease [Azospirillum brasilense]QCO18877.1 hypothetical protein D3869_26785 [Azospirillum brasilense]